MIKKSFIHFIVLIIIVTVFFSCSSDSDPVVELDGTWTINTTPTSGTNHGIGSFDVAYNTTIETDYYDIYVYIGSGLLDEKSFFVIVSEYVPKPELLHYNFQIEFRDTYSDLTNMIRFQGILNGNMATGNYIGEPSGIYFGDVGSFETTKS